MSGKRVNRGKSENKSDGVDSQPRIVGGKWRSRKIAYHGDPRTRPMKARVREAVFNLVGPSIKGMHVLDLFAGTGAIGLEALSRGAARATFIERHFPTADLIRRNVAQFHVEAITEIITFNTFHWGRNSLQAWSEASAAAASNPPPWVIFCSPPYDLYLDQTDDLLQLLEELLHRAPLGSVCVVEADERFSFDLLPGEATEWDVRTYFPAFVGIRRLTDAIAQD